MRPSKRSYESISGNHDDERCYIRPRYRFLIAAGLSLALAGCGGGWILLYLYQHMTGALPEHGDSSILMPTTPTVHAGETIPTLLSLRDVNGQLISAKTNPLYDRLRNATTVRLAVSAAAVQPIVIVVRSYSVAATTSTQQRNYMDQQATASSRVERPVSCWDMSFLMDINEAAASSRLVALRCATNLRDLSTATASTTSSSSSSSFSLPERLPQTTIDHSYHFYDHHLRHHIYELATVSQLQTTVQQQSRQCHVLSSNTTWSLPVPTSIRVPYCQWIILLQEQEEEVETVTNPGKPRQRHDDDHLNQDELVLTVLAVSNVLALPTSPLNVHLAYRTDPTELVVQFSSVLDGTPVVELDNNNAMDDGSSSSSSTSSSRIIKGTTTSYGADDLCQAPANTTGPGQFQSPGYLHTVILSDLPVNAPIAYRVGLETGQGVIWRHREPYMTHTNLPAGNKSPYTYLVYGDQGCPIAGWEVASAWIDTLVERETNHSVRSIHHIGDLSYAQGVAHQWDAWLSMLEPAMVRWPLMIAVGNHEYDYMLDSSTNDPSGARFSYHPAWGNFALDSGGECAVPVVKRFQMPDTGNSVFWYSYDSGLVHTIVLSSEHNLADSSDQHEWFRNDLQRVDRTLTPWLIVELHRPLYENEAYWEQNTVGIGMRDEIEHLLYDYQVDLVLSGHYHAYHRTCDGLYRSQCNNGGPLHLTIGTAGARLDETDSPTMDDATWTEKLILGQFGYGRVTVHNASALHLEFVRHGVVDDPNGGSILDDFWLERQRR